MYEQAPAVRRRRNLLHKQTVETITDAAVR